MSSADIFSGKEQPKTKLLQGDTGGPSGEFELANGGDGGAETGASIKQESKHLNGSARNGGTKKLELSRTIQKYLSISMASSSDEEQEEEEDEDEEDEEVLFNLNSGRATKKAKIEKWEEAALYVQEGENNTKFDQRPNSYLSKLAYGALHYPAYHILHLIIAVLLLLLAMAEFPAVGGNELNPESKKILLCIHGVLELFFLSLLSFDIVLKCLRFGMRHFLTHRTVLIACVLAVMYVEALTVLIRQDNHIRVTRLLRPLFLIDTYYMMGMRRVLRQIFLSLKDIIHVLFLMMFFILLFTLFGYLIFSVVDPIYFSTFSQSFVSLFITLTTANNPDVMLDSYLEYPATPLFFIVYIIVTLYLASNVLLGVVYSSFRKTDKRKFRKLLCHKIDALKKAFHILKSASSSFEPFQVHFEDFLRFMAFYKPRIPEWQVMCIFKALHRRPQDQHHGLDLEEFQHFYEVIDFKWEQVNDKKKKIQWFSKCSTHIKKPFKKLHSLVNNRLYKFCLGLVVLVNLVFLVAYTTSIQDSGRIFKKLQKVLPVSFVFLSIYIVDILLNMVARPSYFKKFWYIADLFVIILSLICLCLEPTYHHLAIVRPLKLLRLVRMKRRYGDIMNTMIYLVPHLLSVFFLILIIYYAFAIVGLEFFAHKVSPGCCNESWYGVELYYSETANITHSANVYYLNNFNNILRSYVTLFNLMVVNNWYIIMEGFASVGHYPWLARLYFISFYIITLVVLQVVISFIVEAFVFKIQATQKRRKCSRHPNADCNCKNKKEQYITLVEEDIKKLKYQVCLRKQQKLTLNRVIKLFRAIDIMNFQESVQFLGQRDHTKEDIHMLMYKDEIKTWIKLYKRLSKLKKQTKKTTLKQSFQEMMGKVLMETKEFLLD